MKILFVLLNLIYSSLAMSGWETTCSTDYYNGVLKITKCYNRDTKETYYKNPHTGVMKNEKFYYKNIGKNSIDSQDAKFIT